MWDTADFGHGFPDIIVGLPERNLLREIKTANGYLTEEEKDFFASWQGPKDVVRSIEESLISVGVPVLVAIRAAEVIRERRGKPVRKGDVAIIREMLGMPYG